MGFYVPEELKKCRQWIVQRDKVPYMADGSGRQASSTDAGTWTDYGTAVQALQYGDFDGLGFVFTSKDAFTFIDLDNAIDSETGEYSPLAVEVLGAFSNCYAEISQSETGLHIVCKSRDAAGVNNREHGIEIYSSGRYMAFTGNAIQTKEPRWKVREVAALRNKYGRRIAENAPALAETREQVEQIRPRGGENMQGEAATLARARSGEKAAEFVALYAGQWQGRYKSQSEADMRLIGLLWFYSYQNEAITESLFLKSGLGQRDKAQRGDYVRRSIDRVKTA